jgi:acetyltransferase EpsM
MIYLYGASGHAKVIIEILEKQDEPISALIDADPDKKSLLGYPVYQQMPRISDNKSRWIICIGNNTVRRKLALEIGGEFISAIHPSANISSRSRIGQGSVVMASVTINCDTVIGNHVILNTNCSVDHDCRLGDYVHISPNAALAGDVTVNEGTHIGIGVSIIQGIKIGRWATIGAGAVIIEDVPDYAVVVGNPGKIIKYNQSN